MKDQPKKMDEINVFRKKIRNYDEYTYLWLNIFISINHSINLCNDLGGGGIPLAATC